MLYLLEDRDYLKIGYSKNVEERLKTHRTSNCYIQLLGTKPGTSKDEKALHKLCEQYKHSTEGFYNVPEVKEIFEIISLEQKISFELKNLGLEIITIL